MRQAGQPLTFAGVAAWSRAGWGRLLVAQAIVGTLSVVSVVWFLSARWGPVFEESIGRLPDEGEIQNGVLRWHGPGAVQLGANKFLSISVDIENSDETGAAADLQCELGWNELRVQSILGYIPIGYPEGWIIGLSRLEVEPWWGAWRPAVVAGISAGVFAGLILSWAVLASLYSVPARLIAFYLDRALDWPGAWQMSAAALFPGALLMMTAIGAYSTQRIGLLQLILALPIHLALGWVYLAGALVFLPRVAGGRFSSNPFQQIIKNESHET